MARFVASLLYFGFIVFAAGAAIAQSTVPDRRVVVTQDVDFVGSDIANIFDTTLRACEAACLNNFKRLFSQTVDFRVQRICRRCFRVGICDQPAIFGAVRCTDR